VAALALAFDDWRASGMASKVCGAYRYGPYSNAYFMVSLYGVGGGAGRAEFHLGPPCRAATESLNGSQTKFGHIFTCDCYLKNLVRTSSGIYSPRAGAKKLFFLDYRL